MSRTKWWVCGLVLTLAVVLTFVVLRAMRRDHVDVVPRDAPNPEIAFALDSALVPGWRTNAAALGLPDGTELGRRPFSTAAGRAYFLSECSSACDGVWLYGIDTHSGAALFQPVKLSGARYAVCSRNGPSTVICLDDSGSPLSARVVDLQHGKLTFSGATELGWNSGARPWLRQASGRDGSAWAIAEAHDKGIYGVSSRAELTWFVPGIGQTSGQLDNGNAAPLAIQLDRTKDPVYRVFSVVDGRDLTPTAAPGVALKRAVTYPGGFAYQFEAGSVIGVMFYDELGRMLSRRDLAGYNLLDTGSLPVVLDSDVFRVFRADGIEAAAVPADMGAPPNFYVAGASLYYMRQAGRDSSDQRWQRWDLNTGKTGSVCTLKQAQYVGANGNVVLATSDNALIATDMSTCKSKWQWPTGDYKVMQVGSGLIAYSQREVMSLGPAG